MLLIFYFTDNQLYVKFQKKLISHLWDNFRQMDQQTDGQSNKGDYNGPHQVYLGSNMIIRYFQCYSSAQVDTL